MRSVYFIISLAQTSLDLSFQCGFSVKASLICHDSCTLFYNAAAYLRPKALFNITFKLKLCASTIHKPWLVHFSKFFVALLYFASIGRRIILFSLFLTTPLFLFLLTLPAFSSRHNILYYKRCLTMVLLSRSKSVLKLFFALPLPHTTYLAFFFLSYSTLPYDLQPRHDSGFSFLTF